MGSKILLLFSLVLMLAFSSCCAYATDYPHEFTVSEGLLNDETYVDFTSEYGWESLSLVKNIINGYLVFTITLPVDNPEALMLYMDYDSDGSTDGLILWGYDEWLYVTMPDGNEVSFPSWIVKSKSGNVFTIKISFESSPIEETYRFYFYTLMNHESDIITVGIPDIEPDPISSSGYEEETLPDLFVVPEVPYGVAGSMAVMLVAFIAYQKRF